MSYHRLDWDSAFFGLEVARIADPDLSPTELRATLAEFRAKGARLVYWASTRACAEDEAEGVLVDEKTTFHIDLTTSTPCKSPLIRVIESHAQSMPLSDLESLAIHSGKYSRFSLDRRIPRERFETLYKTWIRRSIAGEIAKQVLVIREGARISGMVTLGERTGRGDIGLLAVDPNFRGRGYGEALVQAAQNWFLDQGYAHAQVVTQGRNAAACSLYSKCGYLVESVEYFYHFWL